MSAASRQVSFPEWQPDLAGTMIDTGELRFLNVACPTAAGIPWAAKEFSRLWLYHLNYCDFLNLNLTRPGDEILLRNALNMALNWCDRNPTGGEVGWEPYPLSLRIVNWLKFLIRNGRRIEETYGSRTLSRLFSSLHTQALSLEGCLEQDLRANHLLKNIKALMFAGALLRAPDSHRWWARGEELLKRELSEQILSDGGHFERSPMYHAQVLEDFLDLLTLTRACSYPVSWAPLLAQTVRRMSIFLGTILHPDGEIPLLNDSAFGVVPPAAQLLSRTETPCEPAGFRPQSGVDLSLMRAAGYATIRDASCGSFLIFDCGPLGPDYQPGHGHCDVLSYELSLNSQRFIVDTGVSTYECGTCRQYERSTSAHNTLRIDQEEQAEIWGSFRLGRRPRIGRMEGGEIHEAVFVRGEYVGGCVGGVTHSRTILYTPEKSWVVVDSVRGNGRHRVESFLHFHPSVHVQPYAGDTAAGAGDSQARWRIALGSQRYVLTTCGPGKLGMKESWYSPEFGHRQRQATFHWTWEGELPTRIAYALTPAGARASAGQINLRDGAVEICGRWLPLF